MVKFRSISDTTESQFRRVNEVQLSVFFTQALLPLLRTVAYPQPVSGLTRVNLPGFGALFRNEGLQSESSVDNLAKEPGSRGISVNTSPGAHRRPDLWRCGARYIRTETDLAI